MNIVVNSVPQKLEASRRSQLSIRNLSTVTVWMDNRETVSPETGFPLYPNEAYELPQDLVNVGRVWLMSADGAADVRVLRVG